jgi:hypothetical protein
MKAKKLKERNPDNYRRSREHGSPSLAVGNRIAGWPLAAFQVWTRLHGFLFDMPLPMNIPFQPQPIQYGCAVCGHWMASYFVNGVWRDRYRSTTMECHDPFSERAAGLFHRAKLLARGCRSWRCSPPDCSCFTRCKPKLWPTLPDTRTASAPFSVWSLRVFLSPLAGVIQPVALG